MNNTTDPSPIEAAVPPSDENKHPCTPSDTISVTVNAVPDFEPGRPGVQVAGGTLVHLIGTSEEIIIKRDCEVIRNTPSFTWSLTFQPPSGSETDITSSLANVTTLIPTFLAENEGIYRATLRGGNSSAGFQTASVEINAVPPSPVLEGQSGRITYLRVNEKDDRFGPPNDFLDVEAVIKLDSVPENAFGFQLRDDQFRPCRQGMLDLLRDAFFHRHPVAIDYYIIPGRHNGQIVRVWLTS